MNNEETARTAQHSGVPSLLTAGVLERLQPETTRLLTELGVEVADGRLQFRFAELQADIEKWLVDHSHGRYDESALQLQLSMLGANRASAEGPVNDSQKAADAEPSRQEGTPDAAGSPPQADQPVPMPSETAKTDADGAEPAPVGTVPEEPVAAPDLTVEFTPAGGEFGERVQVAVTSAAPGAVVRYTLDGSEPNADSTRYETGIAVDKTLSLKARAYLDGCEPGPVTVQEYVFKVDAVSACPEPGTHYPPVTLSLDCKTDDAVIRYTLDGSDPTQESALYDARDRIFLSQSATVRAQGFRAGWQPSEVISAQYELRMPEWLNLDPADDSDRVDHEAKGTLAMPNGWDLVGASVRGKLHAHRALWRDDSFTFASEGPWTIAAVSDGAGSATLSRVGSRLACDNATAHLKRLLHGYSLQSVAGEQLNNEAARLSEFLVGAARTALYAIRQEASDRSRGVGEFSATLLVMIHCEWQDHDLVATIQVGDGCIAMLSDEGSVELLGEADHGEHSSETRFLTTRDIESDFPRRVRFRLAKSLRCVAVMTDGISDDFFPEDRRMVELFTGKGIGGMIGIGGGPVDGVMSSVLGQADVEAALLDWIKYERKGSSDDRSLALLYRRSAR